MMRWKVKSLSLSRIEFWLPISFHNQATVLTELSQSTVGLFRLEIMEVSWARYKKFWSNLMNLYCGKQSNGKLRWRWAGNVKMDLHDRLFVLVWGD